MAKLITAAEARKLSGPTKEELVADAVAYADREIRKACAMKVREAHLIGEYFAVGASMGDTVSADIKAEIFREARKQLEKVGFTVEVRNDGQIYTKITWP